MSDTLITEGATPTGADQSQDAAAAAAAIAAPAGEVQEGDADKAAPTGDIDKAEGAPETYDFKAPEGREFDPTVLSQFAEVAKELNLTQEAAQKVIDKIAPALAQRQADQIEAAREAWAESAKVDKEFGGDKLEASLVDAKRALDAFGSPELRKVLNDSALGNHPDVIRFMVKAGKAISEDKFVGGSAPTSGGKSLADRLYS